MPWRSRTHRNLVPIPGADAHNIKVWFTIMHGELKNSVATPVVWFTLIPGSPYMHTAKA